MRPAKSYNPDQSKALLVAINEGKLTDALTALEKGADPNYRTEIEEVRVSVLHLACEKPELTPLVEKLLKEGADPNAMDGRGAIPLWIACERGPLKTALTLVTHTEQSCIHAPVHAKTALHKAARREGFLPVAMNLLQRGAGETFVNSKEFEILLEASIDGVDQGMKNKNGRQFTISLQCLLLLELNLMISDQVKWAERLRDITRRIDVPHTVAQPLSVTRLITEDVQSCCFGEKEATKRIADLMQGNSESVAQKYADKLHRTESHHAILLLSVLQSGTLIFPQAIATFVTQQGHTELITKFLKIPEIRNPNLQEIRKSIAKGIINACCLPTLHQTLIDSVASPAEDTAVNMMAKHLYVAAEFLRRAQEVGLVGLETNKENIRTTAREVIGRRIVAAEAMIDKLEKEVEHAPAAPLSADMKRRGLVSPMPATDVDIGGDAPLSPTSITTRSLAELSEILQSATIARGGMHGAGVTPESRASETPPRPLSPTPGPAMRTGAVRSPIPAGLQTPPLRAVGLRPVTLPPLPGVRVLAGSPTPFSRPSRAPSPIDRGVVAGAGTPTVRLAAILPPTVRTREFPSGGLAASAGSLEGGLQSITSPNQGASEASSERILEGERPSSVVAPSGATSRLRNHLTGTRDGKS